MISSIVAIAVIAGSAFSVSAQSISNQCQSTLAGVATSSDGSCLNAAGLVPLALTGNSTSLVTPINTWLTGFCSQSACTNQSLANVVKTVISGCSSDLASLGFNNDSTDSVVTEVQTYYPTVREIACLKDTSANQLCVTEVLTGIQDTIGTLSINNLISLVPKLLSGSGSLDSTVPKNATCSSCAKQAYNTLNNGFPNLFTSDDKSAIQNECGTSFTDGTQPSGISQTASGLSLAQNNSNSAMAPFAVKSTLASMVVLASGFIVFA